jgi:hypothetical protein
LLKKASESQPAAQTFSLEVTEEAPTSDQLRSIISFVGPEKLQQVVGGAKGEGDALARLKSEGVAAVRRPLVVDWNNGKAGKSYGVEMEESPTNQEII